MDLGFSRRQFTWSNRRSGLANIQEKIDRSIANISWRTTFPNATVRHHPIAPSDHTPIILDFIGVEISVPKSFKFEGFWMSLVSILWLLLGNQHIPDSPGRILFQKIRAVRFALRKGNKTHFGNIHNAINSTKEQILLSLLGVPSKENLHWERLLMLELDEMWKREELLWKQKSRIDWLT